MGKVELGRVKDKGTMGSPLVALERYTDISKEDELVSQLSWR